MSTNPSCMGDYSDCFARWKGSCQLLRSTNFGDRECPFYKSTEQFIAEEREQKKNPEQLQLPQGQKGLKP